MSVSNLINYILSAFLVIALIDKILFKGKYGYGACLDEGIMTMGVLALSMLGIMCFAPAAGNLLYKAVEPLFRLLGADPGMITGMLISCDMGGYPLVSAMTDQNNIRQLSGIYLGSMMGATLTFSIPVSLGIIDKKDQPYLAKGVLAGLVAIPFATMIAAVAGGLPVAESFRNLLPAIALAVLFAVGLKLFPQKILKGFQKFADILNALIALLLGIAILQTLTGISLVKGMDPIGPQIQTVGMIAVTLAGAYPMMHFITTAGAKPLKKVGKLIGINEAASAGIIACLANNIPMFSMIKDMDPNGKIAAVAFSVCASFALGDHLGYVSVADKTAVVPMITGKIVGGIIAILIAKLLVMKKEDKPEETAF